MRSAWPAHLAGVRAMWTSLLNHTRYAVRAFTRVTGAGRARSAVSSWYRNIECRDLFLAMMRDLRICR
jgi:hypothetical protein